MEPKNELSVQEVEVVNLEDLFDLEELESKQAPCEAGAGVIGFGRCHNHNETLLRDAVIVPTPPLAIDLDVEELESKQAPCEPGAGIIGYGHCHNHNETWVREEAVIDPAAIQFGCGGIGTQGGPPVRLRNQSQPDVALRRHSGGV